MLFTVQPSEPTPAPISNTWNSVATGTHSEVGQRFRVKVKSGSDLALLFHIPLSPQGVWVLGFVFSHSPSQIYVHMHAGT